ncbi:hypothetical protein C7M84_014785 [Penaeus vannamei]|uniref:DNA2/NAM7 helicase-like C-terminal domain-containing protein n=1 Tax=Penaeus vannamei TaxID=6689 RepID=A0A3R7Q2Y3_PENVA|nr:hypothetical protein C7M84_014785 [Penaeus vannamei]
MTSLPIDLLSTMSSSDLLSTVSSLPIDLLSTVTSLPPPAEAGGGRARGPPPLQLQRRRPGRACPPARRRDHSGDVGAAVHPGAARRPLQPRVRRRGGPADRARVPAGAGPREQVSGQIVVAGDPEQLGPVVHSAAARRFGLDLSFLHRLCGSVLYQAQRMDDLSWVYEPHLVTQLCRNYRSHPDILAVPSRLFYHDSLAAHADRELPNPSCPLLFHGLVSDKLPGGGLALVVQPRRGLPGREVRQEPHRVRAQGSGYWNYHALQKAVVRAASGTWPGGALAGLAVEKIRVLLVTFGLAEGVKVGSVEEFQGQERKAVVVSTVRSSSELVELDLQHSLGFVQCRRRFNVAVTRAQSVLVLVGNPWLLRRDECWRELIAFCVARGAYRGPDLDAAAADEQAR